MYHSLLAVSIEGTTAMIDLFEFTTVRMLAEDIEALRAGSSASAAF
jgi:hypothetical protein